MTDPYGRTPNGFLDRVLQRVGSLEHRIARGFSLPPRLTNIGSGTTAERNALFGDPASLTNPEKVALADRQVLWFNTDLGWQESYYVVTGLGATVRQLLPGTVSGWYPVGKGPWWRGSPNAGFAASANTYVRGWGDLVRTVGGADWFTYEAASGGLQLRVAGVYRATWWSTIQPGSGQMEFYARILDPPKTGIVAERPGNTTTLSSTYYTQAHATLPEWPIAKDNWLFLLDANGAANVHQAGNAAQIRGNFSVEYVGPAFV